MTNKKAVKDKYKVAVVKREVEFSKETYNRAYNDLASSSLPILLQKR